MKVIGTTDRGYIIAVSHEELEKAAGLYYGKMPVMKVGDERNIGEGYDFTAHIKSACADMQTAMKSFERSRSTLENFASMVADLPEVGAA